MEPGGQEIYSALSASSQQMSRTILLTLPDGETTLAQEVECPGSQAPQSVMLRLPGDSAGLTHIVVSSADQMPESILLTLPEDSAALTAASDAHAPQTIMLNLPEENVASIPQVVSHHSQGTQSKISSSAQKKMVYPKRHAPAKRQTALNPQASSARQAAPAVEEKPEGVVGLAYQCGLCSAAFELISQLSDHIASHAPIKPFKCGQCQMSFSTSRQLAVHTITHTIQQLPQSVAHMAQDPAAPDTQADSSCKRQLDQMIAESGGEDLVVFVEEGEGPDSAPVLRMTGGDTLSEMELPSGAQLLIEQDGQQYQIQIPASDPNAPQSQSQTINFRSVLEKVQREKREFQNNQTQSNVSVGESQTDWNENTEASMDGMEDSEMDSNKAHSWDESIADSTKQEPVSEQMAFSHPSLENQQPHAQQTELTSEPACEPAAEAAIAEPDMDDDQDNAFQFENQSSPQPPENDQESVSPLERLSNEKANAIASLFTEATEITEANKDDVNEVSLVVGLIKSVEAGFVKSVEGEASKTTAAGNSDDVCLDSLATSSEKNKSEEASLKSGTREGSPILLKTELEIKMEVDDQEPKVEMSDYNTRSKKRNFIYKYSESGAKAVPKPKVKPQKKSKITQPTTRSTRKSRPIMEVSKPVAESEGEGDGEKPFACADCPKRYKLLTSLKNHRISAHDEGNGVRHQCPHCDKEFPLKAYLNAHIKNKHTKRPAEVHKCPECGKTFGRAVFLKRHMELHSDERPFQCSKCPAAFKRKKHMEIHIINVHETIRHTCKDCGQGFKFKIHLATHPCPSSGTYDTKGVLTEGMELEKPFSCDSCPKKFQLESSLKVHKELMHELWDGESHKCPLCGKEFTKKNYLRNHIHKHEDDRPFQCVTCLSTFKNKQNMIQHVKNVHHKKRFECTNCTERFKFKTQFMEHLCGKVNPDFCIEHPADTWDGQYHTCSACQKEFRTKVALKRHMERHNNERPFLCSICGASFRSKKAMQNHIENMHHRPHHKCNYCNKTFRFKGPLYTHICPARNNEVGSLLEQESAKPEKPYQCSVCLIKLKNRRNLEEHTLLKHRDETPHVCFKCGMKFKLRRVLNAHLRRHKMGERPFKCSHCSKTFTTKQHMLDHSISHSNQKPFKCEDCGKRFKLKRLLTIHWCKARSHGEFDVTGRLMGLPPDPRLHYSVCHICGHLAQSKGALKSHLRTHLKDRPFKCDMCDLAFLVAARLRAHQNRVHYKIKKYLCDLCDRAFGSSASLALHKISHSDAREHKCSVCGKEFKYLETLRRHYRRNHPTVQLLTKARNLPTIKVETIE